MKQRKNKSIEHANVTTLAQWIVEQNKKKSDCGSCKRSWIGIGVGTILGIAALVLLLEAYFRYSGASLSQLLL